MEQPKIEIRDLSGSPGQCLFTIHMPDDHEDSPSVQQQFPIEIARWLKDSADKNPYQTTDPPSKG